MTAARQPLLSAPRSSRFKDYTCQLFSCGSKFRSERLSEYCSPRCRTAAYRRRKELAQGVTRATVETRPCDTCGGPFTPSRAGARYCDLNCRIVAKNATTRNASRSQSRDRTERVTAAATTLPAPVTGSFQVIDMSRPTEPISSPEGDHIETSQAPGPSALRRMPTNTRISHQRPFGPFDSLEEWAVWADTATRRAT